MRVADIVLQLHLLAMAEQRIRIADHFRIQRLRHLIAAFQGAVGCMRASIGLHQKRVEIEIIQILRPAADLLQQIGAANHIGQLAHAKACQNFAHFFRDEGEKIDHLLRAAGEFGAQRLILRADANRAGIGMALPHHDAAHGHQGCRANAEFLGAQHGRNHHIAPGLDAAIGAQLHAMPQAIEQKYLMGFRKPHFPRQASIFD